MFLYDYAYPYASSGFKLHKQLTDESKDQTKMSLVIGSNGAFE